jgi:hypothetical protein
MSAGLYKTKSSATSSRLPSGSNLLWDDDSSVKVGGCANRSILYIQVRIILVLYSEQSLEQLSTN